jgi:hypothetical protein
LVQLSTHCLASFNKNGEVQLLHVAVSKQSLQFGIQETHFPFLETLPLGQVGTHELSLRLFGITQLSHSF